MFDSGFMIFDFYDRQCRNARLFLQKCVFRIINFHSGFVGSLETLSASFNFE